MDFLEGIRYSTDPVLPNAMDREIARRLESGAVAGGVEDAELLRTYAFRMATLAVRESSEKVLRIALRALVVAGSGADIREVEPIVLALYTAARRLPLSPRRLFREFAAQASPSLAGLLRRYSTWGWTKSLSSMMLREVGSGPTYSIEVAHRPAVPRPV
jgi:hypothetical protein